MTADGKKYVSPVDVVLLRARARLAARCPAPILNHPRFRDSSPPRATTTDAARRRWEFTAPKYYDFDADPDVADADAGVESYFESAAPRALATPRGTRVRAGATSSGFKATRTMSIDAASTFMSDPENRGVNGDVDRTSPREGARGKTPGRTPGRRLGAPRREAANGCSKTPASESERTPVRRSPRLAVLAESSEKKSEDSSAKRGTTPRTGRKSRFASQTPAKRILKTPHPIVPRAAVIAKHKETLSMRASKSAAGTVKKTVAAASRYRQSAKKTTEPAAEKFRSRKEKLRAFEIGGRTTDYEDLTQIPASTTTTRAVSPKFTRTRMKQKILTTEERELLEIQNQKAAMEKEKERRRASSYAPPYTTIKSKVTRSLTSRRISAVNPAPTPTVDDVSAAVRRTRSRRTSAPSMNAVVAEQTPADARKRKRISITGAVLTEIAPFNLSTEQRGAYHQRKFARMRREEEERENVARPAFRAKPVPAEQQAGVSITRTQLAAMLRRGSGMSR